MQDNHLLVTISAEDRKQADNILNSLFQKKLVTGGQIISSPARFLWKGKITDMDYVTITSYTLAEFKKEIIKEVKKISVEEVPMITFVPFDGNKELLEWIEKTLK